VADWPRHNGLASEEMVSRDSPKRTRCGWRTWSGLFAYRIDPKPSAPSPPLSAAVAVRIKGRRQILTATDPLPDDL
jgi:hypothetical protein